MPPENLLMPSAAFAGIHQPGKLNFEQFNLYARFILDNKLREFAEEQLNLSRELDIPILKLFGHMPHEQLVELSVIGVQQMLLAFAENRAAEFLQESVQTWVTNQVPMISRNQVVTEDITLGGFIRRKTFRKFLSFYTTDFDLCSKIMDELDTYIVESDTIIFKILIDVQQELYKQAQGLAKIGNWIWDLTTKKITWSDEMYRIYGLDPKKDEITYEKAVEHRHPDDRQLIETIVQKSLETLHSYDFYYRIVLKDGKIKTVHAKGSIELDENHKPQKMFGTLQDITEQQNLILRLQESEKLFKQAQGLTHIGNWSWDLTTNEVEWSDELYRIYGLEPQSEKITLDRFTALVHPEDRENVARQINESVEKQQPNDFFHRILLDDGTVKTLHAKGEVQVGTNGKTVKMFGTGQDVTELKRKNEEIKRVEERYHNLIDEMQDYAILLLDKEGTIQNWNKGAEKIKGYNTGEIIGKSFRLFYTEKDLKAKLPEKLLQEARLHGKTLHEGWRVKKDGTRFWGSVVITAMHDKEGNITGFSKITRDLTEKKLAEDRMLQYAQSLEQKNQELERSYKELESFSYIASHDLQEPLRKIKTFAMRIAEKEKLSEQATDYFNRITGSATHMQKLIDALLDYSRTSAPLLNRETIDLNTIAEHAISNLKELIEEKNATVEFIGKLPVVKAVAMQFQQVFSNIITNALKYSKQDVPPHIKISSEIIPCKNILPSSKYSTCHKISIADNGIGFEQQYAEKIFELFQRLHGKGQYAGTGIGLSICKKIVQNHEGAIKASSQPGVGTTFYIYLPVEE